MHISLKALLAVPMFALAAGCVEPIEDSTDLTSEVVSSVSTEALTYAALACYVDTTAFDPLRPGFCVSGWRPGQPNPTTAHFEVIGLPAGSYRFTWSTTECSSTTAYWCNRRIRNNGVPLVTSVLIRDNASGATKRVEAQAEYLDVWN
ncbi:MAG: hypothetical protein R3B48_02940 [Kofleriaceae bacterium]